MSKNINKKPATAQPASQPASITPARTGPLDWASEVARIKADAKAKGGSRGDVAGKVADYMAGDTPAASFLRERCGDAGGQAIIEQPRNVLGKLIKLAGCVVSGAAWCSFSGLQPEGRRKEDASVAVAASHLLADDASASPRQKEVIAYAVTRYPGGKEAQMAASLEALAFCGLVERKGGARNAEYSVKDAKRLHKLIPTN